MTQVLFATHPMSDERYHDAVKRAESEYMTEKSKPIHQERYMDHTAELQKIEGAIKEMQAGEELMAKKQYEEAEKHFSKTLTQAPDDYAGPVMMAKCQTALKKNEEAKRYAQQAKEVYQKEAQAYHISGYANLKQKKYDTAHQDFTTYEKQLPGNPNTIFFKGLSLEGMVRKEQAATESRYTEKSERCLITRLKGNGITSPGPYEHRPDSLQFLPPCGQFLPSLRSLVVGTP